MTSASASLRNTRTLILVAGVLSVSGIALSAMGSEDVGKWLTLLGVVLLVVGLHRFGRSGPDEPLELEPALSRPKRKKRSKRKVSERAEPAEPEPDSES